MDIKPQPPYTKQDFRDDLLLVKSDIEESEDFSDDLFWFIRVLDRSLELTCPRYAGESLSEAMKSCVKVLEIGFSKLHSLEQDPNKAPFPLLGGFDPEDLRPWFTWTNGDDLIPFSIVEETVPRWSSANPMSKYYIPNPGSSTDVTTGMPSPCRADTVTTDYFKSILRPWCHSGSAFLCLNKGEAAWECLQPGLVSREVLTPQQEETWRRRQRRRDLHNATRMAHRRQQLALYFARTYHYTQENLEIFLGFAARMEQNARQLEGLAWCWWGWNGDGVLI